MWREFDATNFRRFRNMVQDSHTVMGGVLCALNLKMSSWKERFPNPDAGGPMKRAEFIMTELQQGLDRVRGPGFQPGKNGLNFHEGASTPAPAKGKHDQGDGAFLGNVTDPRSAASRSASVSPLRMQSATAMPPNQFPRT